MKKKVKINIIVVLFIILMAVLIYVKIKNDYSEEAITQAKIAEVFENVNTSTYADVTKYIVYGTHFNLEGSIDIPSISGISISNVKLIIKDLEGNEESVDSEFSYSDGTLSFSTIDEINDGIYLDGLNITNYYIFIKVELSNSEINYYSLKNETEYENIKYYTVTKENRNNKVYINFDEYNDIDYMEIEVSEVEELPDNVCDIAIDPGHGGSDYGSKSGDYKESEIVLEIGLKLKEELEELGYKVLITRDGSESNYTDTTDVYADDGRVTLINESHAKLTISLHMDSNSYSLSSGGIEVYAPCNCDLTFAQNLADNLVSIVGATYSPLNVYKKYDGVYVHNYNDAEILAASNSAKRNGYDAYDITTSTPYLYIIRETGGIATNAYVDGRNTNYSANKYYNSNIGVESYLLELGYIDIKKDLNNLLKNEDLYVQAIVDSITLK